MQSGLSSFPLHRLPYLVPFSWVIYATSVITSFIFTTSPFACWTPTVPATSDLCCMWRYFHLFWVGT
jgi:hypothetical protein